MSAARVGRWCHNRAARPSGRLLPLPCVALILGLVAAVAPPRAFAQDSKTSSVDLVQVQLIVPSKLKIGKTFLVLDELENQGEHPSANSLTGFCLSEDDVCDERDLRVGARRVPPLAPLTAHAARTPFKLPDTVRPGSYYFIAIADAARTIEERYKGNNTRATKVTVLPAGK